MMKPMPRVLTLTLALLLCSTPVLAAPITYTTTGGKADFDFLSASSLHLTLTNTYNPVDDLGKVLTGLAFTLSPSATLTLTSVISSNGSVDCHVSYPSCAFTAGPLTDNSAPFFPNDSNNGWTVASNLLSAGAGSYKDHGIVNSTIVPGPSSNGNTSNDSHNPFLNGPVEFDFTVSGVDFPPGVTAASFYFGTGPTIVEGNCQTCPDPPQNNVPEPPTLLLLGSSLVGVGAFAWRRRER